MNPQGTYPQGEREDFQEWKERDLYYEAQASIKPNDDEGQRCNCEDYPCCGH